MPDKICDIFSLGSLETGLKVTAVFATGFFAGGGTFIAYAFEPGVLSISNHCALVSYRAVLPRCKPMPLSILIGSLASAGVYAISVHNNKKDTAWLVGAGILAAIVPQTIAFIGPINKRIMSEEVPEDDAPEELGKWAMHHMLRTAAVCGLFAFYTYKLAKKI